MYKKSSQSISALNQWVQEDKTMTVYSAVEVLGWEAQPLEFPSFEAEKFSWQDFLCIPVLLNSSACKFITAQQFGRGLEGGEGGIRKKEGMEVEKQKGQPYQPWDLPWLATATPPLGKSQLSLAKSDFP